MHRQNQNAFTPLENHKENKGISLTGFTLLELIAVVIIIGILAAIALPRYSKTVENSRMSEATNMLGIIREAQLRYAIENEDYATDIAYLDVNVSSAGRFFNFKVYSPNPYDANDEKLARAIRNGDNVGGGYRTDYYIFINESGGFDITLSGGGAPPG